MSEPPPAPASPQTPLGEALASKLAASTRRYVAVYPAGGQTLCVNDAKSIQKLSDDDLRKRVIQFLHQRQPDPADRPVLVFDCQSRECFARPYSRGMEWVTLQKPPAGV